MGSRSVVEIIQLAGFVLALGSALLLYAHHHRLVRAVIPALAMGTLGVLAVHLGTVSNGPVIPVVLFIVGFIVAALAPRVSKVGRLTDNRLRAIGFVLGFLTCLIQFLLSVVEVFGIKIT